ncbi:WD40 repeat-like protein [Mycena indigotica]|uniref:WD40 repeat-like protein n=1 Tax=Mycena indigotica TaxID=2126181 RepID=A0A8H6S0L2_9AGAR|nr:WD40 repeat-like protein [Mycena indigotica]KAF7291125.1 WD40 repeat-like protein [Mycena indigotica]
MTNTKLPILNVQHTFPEVISDVRSGGLPQDTFWLSCYGDGPGIHSKVRVTLDDIQRDVVKLDGSLGIEIKEQGKNVSIAFSGFPLQIALSISRRNMPCSPASTAFKRLYCWSPRTYMLTPIARIHNMQPHRITAFDVAPDGSQFASGFLDGSVHIYNTTPKIQPVETAFGKIHKSTTSSLRFFPSSRVLLSAGADFTLCILPAEPSPSSSSLSAVRTLMGHKRVVTSTAIVSRGRNIVSGSLDGTIRLWDVSSGAQIHLFTTGGATGRLAPITGMSLGERGGTVLPNAPSVANPDTREVETSDKLLFCALQTKSFEAIDLGSRQTVFSGSATAPLSSISYSPENSLLATGSNKGIVDVYDTRALSEGRVLVSFARGNNQAGIADLQWANNGGQLLVGTDDGLPFIASIDSSSTPRVAGELVGTDCDAVRCLRAAGNSVWTAADDGVVRRYDQLW